MIKHGESIVWSPTDLTKAAACEYGFLRALDRKLGRADKLTVEADPLQDQIAELGNAHERRVLDGYRARFGVPRPGAGVIEFERAASATAADLAAQATLTRAAFDQDPDVVFQAGFFDGEFHGYADFIRRTPEGWVVGDTKIARRAKTSALLQIAAYADQLQVWGLPVAPYAELILGTGEVVSFPLADILPVFRERRDRLRILISDHVASDAAATWDAAGIGACGSCPDCTIAVEAVDDILLVAGMRMAQRRKFKDVGIHAIPDFVAATEPPAGMAVKTFANLRAQATLQWAQIEAERAGTPAVTYEVFDQAPLRALPAPSPGDLFFDFEGDPMYSSGPDGRWGLEYLWGVLRARVDEETLGEFWPLWADDHVEERDQLVAFLDEVTRVREKHPDMHIYHYAPYEITALKRLVAEHKTHENVLDELLRDGVFVDLYAVVRGSVRVSQPSYSIKKLEPLYMSHERIGDVTQADMSIAYYHLYRELLGAEDEDSRARAEKLRQSLLGYNRHDCESTLELRDWLLGLIEPGEEPPAPEEREPREEDPDVVALRERLLARAGSPERPERTHDEQTWAMLEGSLGYHQREDRPFWWAHFDRLLAPVDEWIDTRDVITLTDVTVVSAWSEKVGNKLPRRTLAFRGTVGPGSTLQAPSKVGLLYDVPAPDGLEVPVRGLRGASMGRELTEIEVLEDGSVRGTVVEALRKGHVPFAHLPMAVVPDTPPSAKPIVAAIRGLVEQCDAAGELVSGPAIDLLARRTPRLRTLPSLPSTGDRKRDLVDGLLDLDSSYIAVQGPPGTGKTYTGSAVIRELVEIYGWKVGVVGPSHAVVENMLCALVKAGLSPDLIGKTDKRASGPNSEWIDVKSGALGAFQDARPGGYVIGGTAWTFTGAGVDPGSLDLLVIDEAGQFSLANTVGVSVAADRLLLLGDPQQLPQVSQGFHGEPVDQSALSWVIGDHATMPADLGYFLETSYRMHPSVCGPVSRLAYDGKLESAPEARNRDLAGIEPGVAVLRVDHSDNSVSSAEEAAVVVEQVRRFLGVSWTDGDLTRPLGQEDVLVVAPYNAQRQLITKALVAAGYDAVRVGTVDKFQGQEAPVVIVSMTASSPEDVPRGMEFLLSRNRVNVAVSRAQWIAVLVRSERLSSYVPASTERFLELGGFIGLCAVDE